MGMSMVPTSAFFTKGVGTHESRKASYEIALREAGLGAQNVVRVSSIFPPNCRLVPRKDGVKHLSPGEITFAVVAENATDEPHRLIASSIGVAMPTDSSHGYLAEQHTFGVAETLAGKRAEQHAAEIFAITLDAEFDVETSWDKENEIYRVADKLVRTANITQSAVGDEGGRWTTTIAAAVMLFDEPKQLSTR